MPGESAPVFAIIHNWVNEFKCSGISTKDEHHSGCTVEVSTPEMINKIHNMVLSDRRIKLRKILEARGVSIGTVVSIMRKISSKWVPCLFSADKRNCAEQTQSCSCL